MMKKLEKLKLHNLEEICVEEQRSLRGGTDDAIPPGIIGEVVVYGTAPHSYNLGTTTYGGSVFDGENGFSSGGGFLANYLYNPDLGPDQIWDAFRGWTGSDVPYNADTTSAGGATTMGITATFSRSAGTLTIYDGSGTCLGIYAAGNNVTTTSEGIWPNGTYEMLDQNSARCHNTGDTYDGSYGVYGIYRAENFLDTDGDLRDGMAIHAGRSDDVNSKTEGCIRTTEAAMSDIQSYISNCGPFRSITVTD